MARHTYFSPFLLQDAFGVYQECASFNAHVGAAVQFFFLDHIKLFAQFFITVGQKVKWEAVLVPEIFMGPERVARYAKYVGTGCIEQRIQVTKILAFGCATGGIVLGVEVDYQAAAFEVA
jgi:hypothetical protein